MAVVDQMQYENKQVFDTVWIAKKLQEGAEKTITRLRGIGYNVSGLERHRDHVCQVHVTRAEALAASPQAMEKAANLGIDEMILGIECPYLMRKMQIDVADWRVAKYEANAEDLKARQSAWQLSNDMLALLPPGL